MYLQGLGVARWDLLHGSEVFLDAALLEASFGEILRGADEDTWAALDGRAEGGEVAAGFGS